MKKKITKHRPPHTSFPNTYYFISARTYYALPFLRDKQSKEILLKSIKTLAERHSVKVIGWVVLNNHYHLQFRSPGSEKFPLGNFTGQIHGRSSRLITNQTDQTSGIYSAMTDPSLKEFEILKNKKAKIMGQKYVNAQDRLSKEFIDIIDSGDSERLKRFMKNTPKIWYQYTDHIIKGKADFYRHLGYIFQNPVKHGYVKDMLEYQFSSIHETVGRRGKEFVLEMLRKYPIRDFEPSFEDW